MPTDAHRAVGDARGAGDRPGRKLRAAAGPDADRRLLVRRAAGRLPGETPVLDAELLLAAALGEDRLAMLLGRAPVQSPEAAAFAALVARRVAGEPIAYILGVREFWSLPVAVTPDVLIPRPDSETLIEAAVALLTAGPPARILDLGTGSGALLLAALSVWKEAWGVGVDCARGAIGVARGNARALGMDSRTAFLVGDWASSLKGPFDLVLANPPYVPEGAELALCVRAFEPAGALFAGADGLAAYRAILPDLPRLLAPAGVAIVEIDPGHAAAVTALGMHVGLAARAFSDLAGRTRAIALFDASETERFGLGKSPPTH